MKNQLILSGILVGSVLLAGCTTGTDGRMHAAGCDRGVNYAGAGVGAVAGGLAGSLIVAGTGQALAVGAGALAGGAIGSQTQIGCEHQYRR